MTFEEALIEHCSPTLAGVKPASLFRFCPRDSALFARRFLALRQQFAARGLRLVILKGCRRTGSYLLLSLIHISMAWKIPATPRPSASLQAAALPSAPSRWTARACGWMPWRRPGSGWFT